MSDDLTRRIEAIVWQIIAGMDEPVPAIAALIAEREVAARKEGCAWAEAIERWFIEWEMMPDWSTADPWAELHRMICWEQQVALDPAVSEDARKLVADARARAFEEVVGAFNSVGRLMSRGEIIAAIRALAKKERTERAEVTLPPKHQRVMRLALASGVKFVSKETRDAE